MINRRQITLGSVALSALASLPKRAVATDSTFASFHANLPERPWLRLYEGIHDADTGTHRCEVTGSWPRGLAGSLFRNGPGRMEMNGRRYQHWFDGDGLVQRWTVSGTGQVSHHARLVQTKKLMYDESRGELSRVGFGTHSDDAVGGFGPDALNVGNISVLPRNDELWALWEGGSAWRINRDSLATEGILKLSSESAGLPFSAHPRVEPDGTIWNFGYFSPMSSLVVWRLRPQEPEPRVWVLQQEPISMPHDFVVTANHLVLPLPPLHYEPNHGATQSFLDSHTWHPERALEVLVMKKDDPTDRFVVELPAHWVFHYTNAWEDSAGTIRFEGIRFNDPSLMFDAFKAVMRGVAPSSAVTSQLTRYIVDTRKRTAHTDSLNQGAVACEFPVVDQRVATTRHDWVTLLTHDGHESESLARGLFNSVSRLNVTTGANGRFEYPLDEVPEEHVFVPKTGSADENDGWLIGTSLDFMNRRTHLNVFELNGATPERVARATLPRLMPLGLHGKFVSAA